MSTPAQGAEPEVCDVTLRIAGMSCAACQSHVQRALHAVPGVQDATVDLLTHQARITALATVPRDLLAMAVRDAGYDVLSPAAGAGSEASAFEAGPDAQVEPDHQHLGLRALFALAAGALAMLLSMPLAMAPAGSPWAMSSPAWLASLPPLPVRWFLLVLASVTMLFAAPEIYRAAWRAARHRTTNMNTLVALGTLVAFAASAYATLALSIGRPSRNFSDVYFEAVILILAFLLVGRWLEARARDRATGSLKQFAQTETGDVRWIAESSPESLAAGPASLLAAGETLLPLDAVAVGDLLRVLPGDRVPLDGIVLAGRSSVDEAMLTGEPLPVTRKTGDKLFSGTLNLDGPLLFRATALGADSMQAQMARLLERARSTRAPLQRVADRVSAVFVPVVLALAALTFAVWAVVDNTHGASQGYSRALSFAIAVLVVACPCAMGLAVPAAVAVSLGAGARAGILVKGGEALERLASVDTVAFDKTGTLTEGKPEVAAFVLAHPTDERTLLKYAAAVEGASTHPLAAAILAFAAAHDVSPAQGMEARVLPGQGAEATVDGHRIVLGNFTLLPSGVAVPAKPSSLSHATPVYLVVDSTLRATFYATDTPRPSTAGALAQLTRLRLRTILLTGDTPEAANALAHGLGISDVRARLLPSEKLDIVSGMQGSGHRVAMVGDGLNDAAALAHADAGIAMASGTDLAREAGHVLLLHHDLGLVPAALRLARRTRRLMRQNLAWALVYNVLGIPLAAGVLTPRFGLALSPAFASATMAFSSVSVLLNSLRLARPVK